MNKSHLLWLAGGVVVGIVFAAQIKRLPLVDKLPTV
jgi:hypothetical protein